MGATTEPNVVQRSVRRHYDALYWPYLLFWGHHLHHGLFRTGCESPHEAQMAMLRYCVGLLPSRPSSLVIDIGCGYGGTSLFLAREFGCRVLGISLSSRQVRHANARAGREGLEHLVSFAVADAEEFETAPNACQLIWVMESSEHLADRRKFFARASASLCPGGMLLLAAWTAGECAPEEALRSVAAAAVCPSFSSVREYRVMLTDAGLLINASEELTPLVLRTWTIVRSRVHRFRFLAGLTTKPIREFTASVDILDSAFRSRLLTYHVVVATRPNSLSL